VAKTAKLPRQQGERGKGRPRVAESWIERRKHIRIAYCRLVLKRSTTWCSRHYGVSRRTVNYWVKAAMNYDDSEALTLQDLVRGGVGVPDD
jgi:hypothetical protein